MPVKPSETLAQLERLGNLALEPSQLAERLDPVDLVADAYPIQTPTPIPFHLDIFVQYPSCEWQDMNAHYRSANPVNLLPFTLATRTTSSTR